MVELELLRDFGFIVFTALLLVVATRWANVPNIVAYILAGLVFGPGTGLLEMTHTIELISEFGVALLLFLVGLELSIDKIKDVGPVALAAGLGQVVFTAAGGFGLTMLMGFSAIESVFIAVALTFSSTVVVVKLLDQKGELTNLYGRIAVGIFLVQDLVVIVVLTFLAGLSNPEDLEFAEAASSLGLAFGGMALLLAVALLASRYLLPPLFNWIARLPEATFVWSLFWCFLFVVGAEQMELSVEVGAFLAGMAIAQLPHSHDLRRRVNPLVNFFIAVFFVSLGIQMEMEAAASHWQAAIVLSLFVLIGNPFIFMFIIAKMGYGERTSFLTSVTVAQISEFSFIFAAMGLSAGLINESILSLIAIVGLITIALSAYLILYNHELYQATHRWGLLRLFGASQRVEEDEPSLLDNHVIVIGMNTLGRRLVHRLHERGEDVVAVDTDQAKLAHLPVPTVHGNAVYDATLSDAGFARAKLVVSTLHIEDTNNLLAYRCREAGIPCSVHAFDHAVVDDLRALDVDYLLHPKQEGIAHLADELRTKNVLS